MLSRALTPVLRQRAQQVSIVTLTGPRQSGKTTLLRATFPEHTYVSLEDPEIRGYALVDPRSFLGQFSGKVILDEVQRTPDLFSYLQVLVDEHDSPGRFILSGSQNFLLSRSTSQSLAGRTSILHLLPLAVSELQQRPALDLTRIGREPSPPPPGTANENLLVTLFQGFYPRIHDRRLEARVWLADYYRTYVERDVREIVNVGDLETFGRFVRLCASRSAQLLNLSSLANDCGINHSTARRWLSILESSFLVTLLRPYHRNFGRRLIKAPKLYFLDSGLLCYLLRIRSAEELRFHSARGAVFESFVVADLLKNHLHRGLESDLFFWRDSNGREIDIVLDRGSAAVPIEVKSAETVAADFFRNLELWRELTGDAKAPAALIYGGDRTFEQGGIRVYSWRLL